jgi:hypothetical protein
MLWLPTDSVEIEADALPEIMAAGVALIFVAPSKNVTVPLAVEGTVAVKVTDWVYCDGLREEAIEMVPVAGLTTWV